MHRRLLLILIVLFLLNGVTYLTYDKISTPFQPQTLGIVSNTAPNVTVTASIDFCPTVIITPEHRIPPSHNNSLEINVQVRPESSSTPVYDTTVTTNIEGQAQVCHIPASLITDQYYDVLIKGLSHLRRNFTHQLFRGVGAGFTLDLTTPVLFAGDSHPVNDNYVNSLDISYEIINLYTNDLRADLNRDGLVNSLEFPTLISHLYAHGDI